jgi:hypothetical protein
MENPEHLRATLGLNGLFTGAPVKVYSAYGNCIDSARVTGRTMTRHGKVYVELVYEQGEGLEELSHVVLDWETVRASLAEGDKRYLDAVCLNVTPLRELESVEVEGAMWRRLIGTTLFVCAEERKAGVPPQVITSEKIMATGFLPMGGEGYHPHKHDLILLDQEFELTFAEWIRNELRTQKSIVVEYDLGRGELFPIQVCTALIND